MLRARLPGVVFAAALLAVLVHVALVGFGARGLSGLFPAIVGVVGGIAALVNLVQACQGRDARSGEAVPAGGDGLWLAGLSYGVPVAYAALLWLLGFWVASGITLLALPWLLGYRRPVVVLLVCAGTLLAVQLVFVQVFDMVLPRGLLIERIFDEGDG
jgi:hypothetical protein